MEYFEIAVKVLWSHNHKTWKIRQIFQSSSVTGQSISIVSAFVSCDFFKDAR